MHDRAIERTKNMPLVRQVEKYVAGRTVIDIGCNAGLYSLTAAACGAKLVKSFDLSEHYLDQAQRIAAIWKRRGKLKCAIHFHNLDITKSTDLVKDGEVVIAGCVLYYLREDIHTLMRTLKENSTDIIIAQGNRRKYSNDGNVSVYELDRGISGPALTRLKGMKLLFESYGFDAIYVEDSDWPVVVAKKRRSSS